MSTKRTHPHKISQKEAAAALDILKKPGTLIDRLERLLKIKTGKSCHLVSEGFRNDIAMIINAAK
jgi:hypothetical protein